MVKIYDMDGVELPTIKQTDGEPKDSPLQDNRYNSMYYLGFSILSFFVDTLIDLFENVLSNAIGLKTGKNTFWQDFVRKGIDAEMENLQHSFFR